MANRFDAQRMAELIGDLQTEIAEVIAARVLQRIRAEVLDLLTQDQHQVDQGRPSSPAEKLLYDRKSAAFALSISPRTLDTLIANKMLSTRRLGKKVMITAGELRRFARADHF